MFRLRSYLPNICKANSNFGHQQSEHRDGTRGQSNESHASGTTPHTNGTTPHTGSDTNGGRGSWNAGRQSSMPQAQTRSTPSQGTRTFAAASGGNSGRRTR